MLRNIVIITVLYYVVVLFLGYTNLYRDGDGIKIYFVDVGQGDAVFIDVLGKATMLVDGGSDTRLDLFLDNYFKTPNCKVDLLLLTHPHSDHYGGMSPIIKRCKVLAFMFNDVDKPSSGFLDFANLIKNKYENKKIYTNYFAGQKVYLDKLRIFILWPSQEFLTFNKRDYANDLNLISGVLLLDYGEFEVLLTGDAEDAVLSNLDLRPYARVIQKGLDVLKVPHHGSSGGINRDLLAQLQPKICIISVGKGNSYNHPHASTLSLLQSMCRQVLRTDLHGTIELNSAEMLLSDYNDNKRLSH